MAAQLGIFKVIGDSNIRNAFSTCLKISERISGLNTEFVSAAAYSSGMVALADLESASVVLVSFLVNGMVDAAELCSDLDAVDNVIENKVKEYVAAVRMAATINAGTKFYILPNREAANNGDYIKFGCLLSTTKASRALLKDYCIIIVLASGDLK